MQNPTTPAPAAAKPKPAKAAPRPVPPPEFQAEAIDKMGAAELAGLLKNGTEFQKAKACQRLAQVGTAAEVPAISSLLPDEKLSHYARFALEPIPGPEPDNALRAAASKTKGGVLVGVINSIAFRRDAKAAPMMAKLMSDRDPMVAEAAAYALGRISGASAAEALVSALGKTKDRMRATVADACLQCAEGMLAAGQRDQALALYAKLTATDVPKAQRMGAMHAVLRAEQGVNRPK